MFALLAAAEESEPSKVPFYVCAIVLVGYAVVMTIIGTTRAGSFPATIGVRRGVCALSAVLVAATMASAVISS